MSGTFILVEDDVSEQGVSCRTLTLDRPHKANALTARMMASLGAAVSEEGSTVHVLRSASARLFCAGADIAEFVAGARQLSEQEHALLGMIERLARSRVPLVAIARGKASGAGAALLALADVVIAADDLEIGCPEIRFGMFPIIVEAVLQSRMSPALAARICLGQALDAREAHRIGLVSEVLPGQGFDALARKRLDFYLERSGALRMARRSRLYTQPPEQLIARVHGVAPLMAENFAQGGVRERIVAYLAALSGRDRPTGVDVDKRGNSA